MGDRGRAFSPPPLSPQSDQSLFGLFTEERPSTFSEPLANDEALTDEALTDKFLTDELLTDYELLTDDEPFNNDQLLARNRSPSMQPNVQRHSMSPVNSSVVLDSWPHEDAVEVRSHSRASC